MYGEIQRTLDYFQARLPKNAKRSASDVRETAAYYRRRQSTGTQTPAAEQPGL